MSGFKLLVFLVAVAVQPLECSVKIVGGQNAAAARAPYIVSLRYRNKHYCAGSLIGPRTIVTAAHCLTDIKAQNVTVRVGSNFRLSGGKIVRVSSWKSHPDYNLITQNFDLGLIYLKKPLKFSKNIQPIQLYKGRLRTNLRPLIFGWGFTKENGQNPNQLRTAMISIYPVSRCRKLYKGLLKSAMFCAASVTPVRDSCKGDSGGPLVIGQRLAGIISLGIGCARKSSPGVYTNVPFLRRWIQQNS